MKEKLFLSKDQNENENELYAQIRDEPRGKVHLDQLEEMWLEFREFAPKGFRKKLQIEFYQRWWEMYLTVGLLHLGLKIKTSPVDKGPDLSVEINDKRLWIEAVTPKVGITSDRVPKTVNGVSDFPKRECLLRLSSGLDAKWKTFKKYIQHRIIQPEDVCIIAISACDLDQNGSLLDYSCPTPLALLAGAGDMVVTRSPDAYNMRQPMINRDNGSPINTARFEQDDFRIISGVLYSNQDPLNASSVPESTFSLFLNPRADHPVPLEMCVTMETWAEEQTGKQREEEAIWKKIHNAVR